MADAGRIVIIPKGEYKSNITYERLDAVEYNNNGYIALKTVTGITPTNDGTNWALYVKGTQVDGELSTTSENAVKNKVVTAEISTLKKDLNTNGYGELAGGKNLFHYMGATIETTSCSYTFSNNSISITSSSNNAQIVIRGIKVKKNTDYILSVGAITNALSDTAILVYRADNSKNVGGSLTNPSNRSFKISKGDYDEVFVILRHSQNSVASSDKTLVWNNIQIEEGNTSTQYETYFPSNRMLYKENTYQSIELMDIKMLGWSVPRDCPIQNEVRDNQFVQNVGRVDLGSLDWLVSTTTAYRFYAIVKGIKDITSSTSLPNIYCSKYRTVPQTNNWIDGDISMATKQTGYIYITDSKYSVPSDFKKSVKGVYLYYELATPVTTTIDGNEIGEKIDSLLKRIQALESQSASATSKLCSDAIDDLASVVSTQDEAIDELATIVTESEEK